MDLFDRQKQHQFKPDPPRLGRCVSFEQDEPPSPNTDASAYIVKTGTTVNPGVPVLVVWSGGVRYETAVVAV